MSIGDRPLIAKSMNFEIQKKKSENSRFAEVSVCFFKIIFCPTIVGLY